MYDILLTDAMVIPVDPEHHIWEKGYIAITGDRIAALGPMEELGGELPQARQRISLKGHVLLPGLVDGHGHAGHCLIKTLGEHREDWEDMAQEIYYCCTDEEFWYAEGALAAAERLKFGTTTAVSMLGSTPRIDRPEPVGANLEGSASVGIRQLTGIGSAYGAFPKRARVWEADGSFREYEVTPEMAWKTTEETLRRYNGRHPRQICIVAPGRMGLRPDESREMNIRHNREMDRLAREYDVPLHTHAYGGDVQFLYDTTPEVLTPRLSLVHSTGYSDRELEILAETGAYVFHGPTTHSNITGHCRVMEMLEQGVNLAVVTDGTASDRSYDLWRDMKNIQLLQRYRYKDGSLLPCGRVLELCTIEPARALGMDHLIGSLEPGKKADIIAVDVMQPHLAPFGVMPVQRLVYHAMGQDVDWVMVDGQVMMEHRRLTQVSEQAVLERAAAAFDTMMRRLNRRDILENEHLYDLRQG